MKTDRNTVLRAAELSKLILTEDETENMITELGKMAEIISALENADIPDNVPESDLSLSLMREDEVKPSADREKILKNAPEHTGEYFCTPDTFEQGGDEG
ncbi:MAG: Asp-tRNA(Asn)/Glu-tRNA(Gln) amidotransferase subunit GatC [Oscillospiraceae bacterium]|nr:Asp-tRNA(Asn)/Glu-tRNA(Gln) amidotransferase subunit GatC [Oscillospiraceae bacterium]